MGIEYFRIPRYIEPAEGLSKKDWMVINRALRLAHLTIREMKVAKKILYEGRVQIEIAERMGISQQAVSAHYRRALKKLDTTRPERQKLEKERKEKERLKRERDRAAERILSAF